MLANVISETRCKMGYLVACSKAVQTKTNPSSVELMRKTSVPKINLEAKVGSILLCRDNCQIFEKYSEYHISFPSRSILTRGEGCTV